jgi:hypothetical protein
MKNPLTGPWRIVWMSGWDQDYVDMEVPGHITFETAQSGSFQLGLVQGRMDCRIDRRQDRRIEFTWQGLTNWQAAAPKPARKRKAEWGGT